MSIFRVFNDINEAGMGSNSGRTFKTPLGYLKGWGTTVGNGLEGWAPNAQFIHTDGGAAARVYTNKGTITTATWLENSSIQDSEALVFGTGNDIEVLWDGTRLISAPPSGLWAGCPSPLDPDPYKAVTLFDDFLLGNNPDTPLAFWVEVDDATTGTNIPGDIRGGSVKIVTGATDNDYHALRSMSQCFNLLATKELWFEARFRVVEATTNESAWWFGLTDTLTTGGLQANALGPLASYDGVLVWKDEATMAIDAESSNAGTQDTETNMGTFVTNTWTRVGFHVSAAATTGVVTPYFDLSDSGVMTAHSATMNITRAGLEEMHVVMGIKAGPTAAAETLEVDYVKCVQIR